MATPEFHVFLPQMRLGADALVERARAAEQAGFGGIALIDHLVPPGAADQPMFEAMLTATWLAAATTSLIVGHLVLCDAMRHPAMLAKEAVTLDHLSGGRYELGYGWGSVPAELETFGVFAADAPKRVARMRESLEIMTALWAGETIDHDGEFFTLSGAVQRPVPTRPIPIVIGGAGPKTLRLVAKYATWWNLALNHIEALPTLRDKVGSARVSVQQMVAFVPTSDRRDDIVKHATRRFGHFGSPALVMGDANEVIDHLESLRTQGVERFYIWFADFAEPETLHAFGDLVITPMQKG